MLMQAPAVLEALVTVPPWERYPWAAGACAWGDAGDPLMQGTFLSTIV